LDVGFELDVDVNCMVVVAAAAAYFNRGEILRNICLSRGARDWIKKLYGSRMPQRKDTWISSLDGIMVNESMIDYVISRMGVGYG
jgi:hypothetical protein